jgi:hypothetical protein
MKLADALAIILSDFQFVKRFGRGLKANWQEERQDSGSRYSYHEETEEGFCVAARCPFTTAKDVWEALGCFGFGV